MVKKRIEIFSVGILYVSLGWIFIYFGGCISIKITRAPAGTTLSTTLVCDYTKIDNVELLDSLEHVPHLFLNSEFHYYQSNWEVKFLLLKYLHEQFNVNDIVLEYPQSYEQKYNDYLLNGDQKIWKHLPFMSNDSINERLFLSALRSYNLTLDSSDRVRVHCIDIEINSLYTYEALWDIVKTHRAQFSAELIQNLKSWKNESSIGTRKAKSRGLYLYQDLHLNDTLYRIVLRDKYDRYSSLIEGLFLAQVIGFDEMDSVKTNIREQFLYERLKIILSQDPSRSFFGQFGLAHVINEEFSPYFCGNNFTSLATMVRMDSTLKQNLVSIVQIYTIGSDTDAVKLNNLIDTTCRFKKGVFCYSMMNPRTKLECGSRIQGIADMVLFNNNSSW